MSKAIIMSLTILASITILAAIKAVMVKRFGPKLWVLALAKVPFFSGLYTAVWLFSNEPWSWPTFSIVIPTASLLSIISDVFIIRRPSKP